MRKIHLYMSIVFLQRLCVIFTRISTDIIWIGSSIYWQSLQNVHYKACQESSETRTVDSFHYAVVNSTNVIYHRRTFVTFTFLRCGIWYFSAFTRALYFQISQVTSVRTNELPGLSENWSEKEMYVSSSFSIERRCTLCGCLGGRSVNSYSYTYILLVLDGET